MHTMASTTDNILSLVRNQWKIFSLEVLSHLCKKIVLVVAWRMDWKVDKIGSRKTCYEAVA